MFRFNYEIPKYNSYCYIIFKYISLAVYTCIFNEYKCIFIFFIENVLQSTFRVYDLKINQIRILAWDRASI